MKGRDSRKRALQFVDAVLPSADKATRDERKRLVRTNAAKYQWSRTKSSRRSSTSYVDTEGLGTTSGDSTSLRAGEGPPQNENIFDGHVQPVTGLDIDEVLISTSNTDAEKQYSTVLLTAGSRSSSQSEIVKYKQLPLLQLYPSLPEDTPSKLMRFNLQHILPNLLPDVMTGFKFPSISWIQAAMSNPALFHTWMHCGTVHYHIIQGKDVSESRGLLASHTHVIKLINEQMQDQTRACSDDNILAVMGMAAYGWEEFIALCRRSPNQGPLKSLQSLDVYSSMRFVPLHADGLAMLIEMRGGLEMIEMEGLAAVLSYSSIVEATRHLTKPRYPFIPLLKFPQTLELTLNHKLSLCLDEILKSFPGFRIVPHKILFDLFSVIHMMKGYSVMVREHQECIAFGHSPAAMADQRNLIQHRLMSLPANPIDNQGFEDDGMYEVVRLTAVIYSLLVVMPISPSTAPFFGLADRLRRELVQMCFANKSMDEIRPFVWILFMGGIAAIDSVGRGWFVERLRWVLDRLKVDSWEWCKGILEFFLWLGITNDVDGIALWDEAKIAALE